MKHNITFIYILVLHSCNNKFLISHFSWLQMFNSIRRDSLWSGINGLKHLFYHTWFSELLFLFLVILFIPTEARRRRGVLVGIFGGDGELSWWKIIMIIVSIVSILMCICKFCNCDDKKEKSNVERSNVYDELDHRMTQAYLVLK